MHPLRLISPPSGTTVSPEEMVHFEWDTEPAGPVPLRLELYLGLDPDRPEKSDHAVWQRWLLRPGIPFNSYNERADVIGLIPNRTYYWLVAKESPGKGLTLRSEVRSLHVGSQRLDGRLVCTVECPTVVAQGTPVTIGLVVSNVSRQPVRLFYPSAARFRVDVRRMHLLREDSHVWPALGMQDYLWSPMTSAPPELVRLGPGEARRDTVVWPQVDERGDVVPPGEYIVRAECAAEDVVVAASHGLTIT